jgi:integrase
VPTIAKTEKLTEGRVRSLWLWETDVPYIIRDERTPELHLRKGKKRTSFYFYHEQRVRGERLTASKLLGHMPQMTLAEARKEAKKHAGRIASDRHETGKRAATKFADALEDHIAYLERRAEENGKPAMWAGVVRRLGKQLLLPKWGRWSLVEMSKGRRAVKVWHRSVSNDHGPIIANRCVEIIRAVYRRAAKEEDLPPRLPSGAVDFNKEKPSQTGLPFKDFPKWAEAWRKLRSPVHRSYALVGLLTGARPGELSRLRWQDVRPADRVLVIANAKAGADITIPLTVPIVRALKLARGADPERVFPGCSQAANKDDLPARGNALRHTYRSVAAELGFDEVTVRLLMGHSLVGINQKYITTAVLMGGKSLRQAQAKISRRIVGLLGIAL